MMANRNHATIWARVGDEGDETAERIIQFVSSTASRPTVN
jgi:hypothetical protein